MSKNADAVVARIATIAKKKNATLFDVLAPINGRSLAEQAEVLAAGFASGALGAQHAAALAAFAHVLKLANHARDEKPRRALGDAAVKLLASARKQPAMLPEMFPGYAFALDVVVSFAWLVERSALEAIANELEGGARLGLESVRVRFGLRATKKDAPLIAAGFARGIGRDMVLVPVEDEADTIDEAEDDQLEAFARGLVDEKSWRAILAETVTDGRPLTDWMVERLDAAAIGRAFAAMPEATVKGLMVEAVEALLAHEGSAEAFTTALGQLPEEAKLHRTVLAIVTGAKRANERLPIPRPWPTLRSYTEMVHDDVRRVLARALATMFATFEDERVRSFVESRLDAGMTADAIVALSARPALEGKNGSALAKSALAKGNLDSFSEAHGALLAALGKPEPKSPYQLRVDVLVAKATASPPKARDPRWLDALDLGRALANGGFDSSAYSTVWAETEILLAFPPKARAKRLLAAFEERGADMNHAIQLVRVLDEADALNALRAAIRSSTPPLGNWLDYAFRRGSHPRVAARWTVANLLAKLTPDEHERWSAVRRGDTDRQPRSRK